MYYDSCLDVGGNMYKYKSELMEQRVNSCHVIILYMRVNIFNLLEGCVPVYSLLIYT